jgi:hypothetical protein
MRGIKTGHFSDYHFTRMDIEAVRLSIRSEEKLRR